MLKVLAKCRDGSRSINRRRDVWRRGIVVVLYHYKGVDAKLDDVLLGEPGAEGV
jgi:hypothetical protein